jgi:hypothetical protein
VNHQQLIKDTPIDRRHGGATVASSDGEGLREAIPPTWDTGNRSGVISGRPDHPLSFPYESSRKRASSLSLSLAATTTVPIPDQCEILNVDCGATGGECKPPLALIDHREVYRHIADYLDIARVVSVFLRFLVESFEHSTHHLSQRPKL